jgi:hypothetical protein
VARANLVRRGQKEAPGVNTLPEYDPKASCSLRRCNMYSFDLSVDSYSVISARETLEPQAVPTPTISRPSSS